MLVKMERNSLKSLVIYINIAILVIVITLFVLGLEVIRVIHAQASEWLPVQVYETYSTTETSLLYVLILLIVGNLLSIKIRYLEQYKPYIIFLTPIISIILITILILNPHTIILKPNGWPPTQLDNIDPGGIITIILFSLTIVSSFLQIYLEGFMKTYVITLGIIIGALLLSDFIHESGHAISALLAGGEITKFYPFPVLLGGEFAAGYVTVSNVPSNLIPLVLLGGEIFQWITICLLLFFFHTKPKYRRNIFLNTLLIIAFLDYPLYVINNSIGLPHWFLIGGIKGDIILFSDLTNFPLWALIIIAFVQLGIMFLIFCILHFRSREKNSKEAFNTF